MQQAKSVPTFDQSKLSIWINILWFATNFRCKAGVNFSDSFTGQNGHGHKEGLWCQGALVSGLTFQHSPQKATQARRSIEIDHARAHIVVKTTTQAAAPPVWARAATKGQPSTTLLKPLSSCHASRAINTQAHL